MYINVQTLRSSSINGVRVQFAAPIAPRATSRRVCVRVEANDLNKWGDVSGPEENIGMYEDVFEKDTALVLCRVLTSRATQLVLQHLSDTDLFVTQWLNNYCADNAPIGGDDFLMGLLSQAPERVMDKTNGTMHYINPTDLANRIIAVREDLARGTAKHMPGAMKKANVQLLRKHLERTSYTSGTYENGSSKRRGKEDKKRVSGRSEKL